MKIQDNMAALRRAQADAVIDLIGPMLDAWDGVPNDLKSELVVLGECVDAIADMMVYHP